MVEGGSAERKQIRWDSFKGIIVKDGLADLKFLLILPALPLFPEKGGREAKDTKLDPQFPTLVSLLVLLLVNGYCFVRSMFPDGSYNPFENLLANIWFLGCTAATVPSILVYGLRYRPRPFRHFNIYFRWGCTLVGMPCLVAQTYINHGMDFFGLAHLTLIWPPLLFLLSYRYNFLTDYLSELSCVICLYSLSVFGILNGNTPAVIGSLFIGFAVVVIGKDSHRLGGLKDRDYYYVVIAIANYLYLLSLRRY